MTHGLEPITWRQFYEFLAAQDVKFNHQVGSHIKGRTAFGAEIGTCDPNKPGNVPTRLVQEIGRIFGRNLHDTRLWIGYGKTGKAKVTSKRATATRAVIPPPPKDSTLLVERLHAETELIARSGPCRMVREKELASLHRIIVMLANWRQRHDRRVA